MLLLPPGAEANPLAANYPGLAITAKALALAFILAAPLKGYARPVHAIAAAAWSVGFLSNVLVLWR